VDALLWCSNFSASPLTGYGKIAFFALARGMFHAKAWSQRIFYPLFRLGEKYGGC
jgi:hypothetical protein